MSPSTSVHRFGPFEFDPAQYELRKGDERATLPVALNKLLLIFVSQPGKLITREDIADALWEEQGTVDTAAGIYSAIKRLRDQLGDNSVYGVFIETVVGAGYRFVAPVSVVTEPQLEPAPIVTLPSIDLAEAPSIDVPKPTNHFRRWTFAAVGALAVVLAIMVWWRQHSLQRDDQVPTETTDGKLASTMFQHLHPVTFDEADANLTAQAISPSGRFLAWSNDKGISIKTLEGENTRSLVIPKGLHITKLGWFPDESALLVSGRMDESKAGHDSKTTEADQLWRISTKGEAAHLILNVAELGTISPDGKNIAFVRAGQTELWTAGVNGDSQRKLVSSSDGSFLTCILWLAKSDKILVSRSESAIAKLPGSKAGLENALDSTHEIYDAHSGTLLARRPGDRFDSAIVLDDGDLIYLRFSQRPLDLMAVKVDAGKGTFLSAPKKVLLDDYVADTPPDTTSEVSASRDGREFSIILNRGDTDVSVGEITRSSGHIQPSLEHVTRPFHHGYINYPTSWSPDGTTVAFDQGFHGANSVLGQQMDSPAIVTFAGAKSDNDRYAQGHFSPDGRWVLYLRFSADSGHVETIERVPSKGGQAEVLPVNGPIEAFHCSSKAGGRCVLRELEDKRALVYYELDPERGMGRELARVPWQPTVLGDWSISPDGSTVAMANHDPARPEIQLIALSQSESSKNRLPQVQEIPVKGFGTLLEPTWSSNGRDFFVETSTQSGRDLVYVDSTGHASLLRKSSDLIWAVPSPDGKKIAFPENVPPSRNVLVGTAQPSTPH